MYLLLLFLDILALSFARGTNPYCPNAEAPKLDEDGRIVHCLPGLDNSCGVGYVCLFSGHNYQCCPSFQDENIVECPLPMLSVLDADENPLRCNNITRSCPRAGMQCITVNSVPLCCQGTSYINGGGAIEVEVDEEAVFEPRCPDNSFAVVDENSKSVLCNAFNCRKKEQFCYEDEGVSICCETNFEAADERSINGQNNDPLTSLLIGSEKLLEQIKMDNEPSTSRNTEQELSTPTAAITITEGTEEPTTESASSIATLTTSLPEISNANINESTPNDSSANNTSSMLKSAHSEVVSGVVEEKKKVKYEPHGFGGYAVAKSGSSTLDDLPRESNRQFARRFLLQQIKRGWPYHEDFYRPIELLEES